MVLFTEEEIQDRVKSIAYEVSCRDNFHNEPRVMICVLNGAFMFFTDLVRNMLVDCEIDFIQVKSYTHKTQGEIRILKDLSIDLTNKDVYIIDDIYDSGNTMKFILNRLENTGAKSITPVTLFKRHHSNPERLIYGFELRDESFLIGYGLDDVDGLKRNIPYITGTLNDD
jgi:hypoxanthine phosphoribosyltransferase